MHKVAARNRYLIRTLPVINRSKRMLIAHVRKHHYHHHHHHDHHHYHHHHHHRHRHHHHHHHHHHSSSFIIINHHHYHLSLLFMSVDRIVFVIILFKRLV
uniref:Uncharacterized protein n=1 Tax=Vespula pensylvanica TaxID=30213 RepID=A0A834KLZ8_VESPE|nr:hypothetical protein H0235_014020 [Vespula pensylvanica]